MVKKLLLLFIVTFSTTVFAQQEQQDTFVKDTTMILKDIVASPNPFSVTTKIKFRTYTSFELEFSVKDLIGNTVYFRKFWSIIL